MTTTTLRGVFPDPKPVHRRNFVRENIQSLKEMQSYMQENKITSKSQEVKPTHKFRTASSRISNISNLRRYSRESKQKLVKTTHRGMQTDSPEEVKSPKAKVVMVKPKKNKDQGDAIAQSLQKLDLKEKQNFLEQNIKSIKTNKQKLETKPDPLSVPPYYQKGEVPKYLKGKKEPITGDVKSTPKLEGEMAGLVLLPDDERKEYLRVARENYAALIKELNAMPISNDTLKKRKRKIEIEDELKRLDEVIKIFQKPKVFVKADA